MWCNGRVNEPQRAQPTVLHVDMDSFFVSVELRDRPDLVGKPVAAAFDSPRSVISSASYEARAFGVRSAMPLAQARRLCPRLELVAPDFSKYKPISRQVMEIFREFTPLVEPVSIDEAFLDVQGSVHLFGEPIEIARAIRRRIREETELPASVGLAATKFVAKLASQRAKPDGILEIKPARTLDFLRPLPVGAMWGVGAATRKKLEEHAIRTVADLADERPEVLERLVGPAMAHRLHELANGRDAREIATTRREKSISHEETFARDEGRQEIIDRELLRLATKVAERLRAGALDARTIAIKVRYANFETLTRSLTLEEPTASGRRIYRTAAELYQGLGREGAKIRLLGVRAENLLPSGEGTLGLWSEDEEWGAIDRTIDEVREKFGGTGVVAARLLADRGEVVDPRSLQSPD